MMIVFNILICPISLPYLDLIHELSFNSANDEIEEFFQNNLVIDLRMIWIQSFLNSQADVIYCIIIVLFTLFGLPIELLWVRISQFTKSRK